jgi:hypothetical protein
VCSLFRFAVMMLCLLTFLPFGQGQAPTSPAPNQDVLTTLVRSLEPSQEPRWDVRRWAAEALGTVIPQVLANTSSIVQPGNAPPPNLQKLIQDMVVPALRARANDTCEQPMVRAAALRALGQTGPSAATAILDLPGLIADRNWLVRVSAEETWVRLGRGLPRELLAALPMMLNLVQTARYDASVLPGAGSAFDGAAILGSCLGPRQGLGCLRHTCCAVPPICAPGEPEWRYRYDIRRHVYDALASIDSDEDIRNATVRLTERNRAIDAQPAAKPGNATLADEKRTNADRIGELNGAVTAIKGALNAGLDDPEPGVRISVAWALAKRDPAGAIAPLSGQLGRESHPGVQRAIAAAFGNIGTGEVGVASPAQPLAPLLAKYAVPALCGLLGNPDPETRLAAVIALGELGTAAISAVPALRRELLADPALNVRDEILRTLAKIQIRPAPPVGSPPPAPAPGAGAE